MAASRSATETRDQRAAEQSMVVEEIGDRLFRVHSGTESAYVVDLEYPPSCECADFRYRQPEGGCKHLRRVGQTTGELDVPGVRRVDPTLPHQRARFTDE